MCQSGKIHQMSLWLNSGKQLKKKQLKKSGKPWFWPKSKFLLMMYFITSTRLTLPWCLPAKIMLRMQSIHLNNLENLLLVLFPHTVSVTLWSSCWIGTYHTASEMDISLISLVCNLIHHQNREDHLHTLCKVLTRLNDENVKKSPRVFPSCHTY